MAYANHIADWAEIEISEKALKALRAILESEFKAVGGRGELPRVVATKNILKGSFAVDARCFDAGNEAAPSDAVALKAKQWAEYIAAGHATLAALDRNPDFRRMVERLLKPAAPAIPDVPNVPDVPAVPAKGKAPATHSVARVKAKGKRAA